ncbi:MAG: hypothetical protein V8R14_03475 [Clostridia bacterium]
MDEERIRSGKLYDWQKQVLHQYDFAMDYLKRKYPSYTFHLNSCTPKGRDNSWSTFWFCADGYTKTYDLYLYSDEDGNYSCEDNFYGEFLQDKLMKHYCSFYQKMCRNARRLYLLFIRYRGKNTEKVSVNDPFLMEKISFKTALISMPFPTARSMLRELQMT